MRSFPPRGALMLAVLLGPLGLLWLMPAVAHAHRNTVTRSLVRISHDQREVRYRLELEPHDTAEMLGLAPGTEPTDAQVLAGRARLFSRVLRHITVRDSAGMGSDLLACPPTPEKLSLEQDSAGKHVVLTWLARCSAPIHTLVVEYALFADNDPAFRAFVNIRYRGDDHLVELGVAGNRLVWNLDDPPPDDLGGFVLSGVEHIVFGFDHVAFLLCLLLPLAIVRDNDEGWKARPITATLARTGLLVTAFTAAHSSTLIAASLGWVQLDSQLIESVIALSIVLVAIDGALRPGARFRIWVVFLFGLMHGLGFASMLAAILPPAAVVVPLLAFNVGVELGQLALVLLALPCLLALVSVCGAPSYRRWVLPVAALALAVLGLLWLIERLFSLTILGF
ncbi:conserved hypothetical protein [Haliangium ochraceum DSM 14365]|uniref:HupE/UreJ protein n=2 Tax=Haliangium ochraceum TaxID=80816 RepID=D0LSZ2_HALO1|nr:conserved hypothetical protein [Haliangium ochraceum DSM 14365]